MSRHTWRLPAVVLGAAVAIAILLPARLPLQARASLDVIATGLVNPRGLNFGPEGGLYVAEAGSGGAAPCIVNSNSVLVCYGQTGAITRITLGGTPSQTRVVTGLPSLAAPPGSAGAGGSATGAHDVEFQGRGNGYVTIGAALDPARRLNDAVHPEFASVGLKFGRLVRFQPNGKWSYEEDLSAFEALANPDGGALDSNPYGLLALPGRQIFTDAGGNSLNAVAANGSISNLAFFPNRIVPNPFAPPGTTIPMQAVPTTVTTGPDGALYVGQLTGFPFPLGAANVYRVPSNGGTPEIFASDFTKIIDIAFASDGALYVLEISAAGGPPPQGGTGALIRVSPDGTTKTTIVAAGAGLVAPGGIAIARDGSIYVTNFSVSPTGGQVVKIVP
jgi:sugar lactone lactonase YvrE